MFLSWSSPTSAPATGSKSQKKKGGTENEKLTAVGNYQIQGHLRNLKVLKSLEHDGIYLWVLRKLASEVALNQYLSYFRSHGSLVKFVLTSWKRGNISSTFKRGK